MSTTTLHPPASTRPAADLDAGADGRPGVPISRTYRVELRKMVDTRSGRWMVIVMAAAAALVLTALLIWGPPTTCPSAACWASRPCRSPCCCRSSASWQRPPSGRQRTGLVTFILEPRRGRVVVAKVLAALSLAVVVLGAAVRGVGARQRHRRRPVSADVTAAIAGGTVLALLVYVLQGVAFGLLFLNTPVAIVSVLVLPTVWSIATVAISSLEEVGRWLNLDTVMAPLFEGEMVGQDWARLATSAAVWVLLPLAIGTYRVLHREVK